MLTTLFLATAAAAELLPPWAVTLNHRSSRDASFHKRATVVYFMELQAGTPPQTVEIYIDAWSDNLALYGRPNSGRDPGFLHNESSSFKDLQGNLTQDTSFSFWVSDNVSFAGETAVMPFLYNYNNFANYGSWGFGFPIGNYSRTSFWHNSSVGWQDKRVGLFLSRHRKGPGEMPMSEYTMGYNDSELVVGGVNESKYSGELASNPFTPDEHGGWTVPLEGITINGNAVNLTSANGTSTPILAHISTSNEPIHVPHDVLPNIYAHIPGAELVPPKNNPRNEHWQVPCESTPNLDVRFTIGGKEYALNPADVTIGYLQSNQNDGIWNGGPTPASGPCLGAFMASSWNGTSGRQWSIGTSFLKNVYTVFDFETPAVAFAQLAPDAQPSVAGRDRSAESHAPPAMRVSTVVSAAAVIAVYIL